MYIRHLRVAFFILQKLEKYVFGFCLFWSNNNIQSNQNNAIQKKNKNKNIWHGKSIQFKIRIFGYLIIKSYSFVIIQRYKTF